jgi:iron(III) transport system permease protein
MKPAVTSETPSSIYSGIIRRFREFSLISRDPVLFMSLLFSGIFIFVFVAFPIYKTVSGGFVSREGAFDLSYFARYFDSYYGPNLRRIFVDTMTMGLLTATFGTLVGFIFAYATVRCQIPGKRIIHWLALLPTISPPFALALSMILLFGRNGLITRRVLGIVHQPGMNDIYGMDGLVIVQTITFFSVAYLILRAMLERLNPAMEEAAASLGAGRMHIFRTVTLPLLIPGIAGSFLLLFVESLADLGNPLFIAGNTTVLSAQIFLAVIGEYDYQKASALSFVLIIPTLILFLVQRYYVNRRSYISITGKPASAQIVEKDPIIRWGFIIAAYAICIFVIMLYVTIVYGSFSAAWGVDFSPTLRHWEMALTRGVEAILDTTFLSALATPFAAILGMVIAWLVVRKKFSGKEALDFASNLGGAVPGTILGIGFVMAFNQPPLALAVVIYALLAMFYAIVIGKNALERLLILLVGTTAGVLMVNLDREIMIYALGGVYLAIAGMQLLTQRKWPLVIFAGLLGVYVMSSNWANDLASPIAAYSRTIPRGFWSNAIFQFSDYVKVFIEPPPSLLAIVLFLAGILLLGGIKNRSLRVIFGAAGLIIPCALSFRNALCVGRRRLYHHGCLHRAQPAGIGAGRCSRAAAD